MKLHSHIRNPQKLTTADISEMYGLMERHYENISYEAFMRDLAEKDWIIELREVGTETLCGFSTQMLLECECGGAQATALFSGDTIVDKEHWGSSSLAIAWGQLAVQVISLYPDRDLYWFLICKGFRTYRFLSVFFQEFYPCWNRTFPPDMKQLLDSFATSKFGVSYDPQRGVLHADANAYRIKPAVDMLSDSRNDPHVKYFLERNPHYDQGDELCCLTPLKIENFSLAARRLMDSPAFLRTNHYDR